MPTINEVIVDLKSSPQRVLPLEGGRNFRDLGGYSTGDGRKVRWGHVYRSGVLIYLTPQDHASLASLQMRVICDFRTLREREREPTRWPDGSVRTLVWEYDASVTSLRSFYQDHRYTEQAAHEAMLTLYRKLPKALLQVYTGVFQQLAGAEFPIMVHCSAGKDRTGLASALILSALGVSHDHIVADYVLTDQVVDLEAELFARREGSIGVADDHAFMFDLSPEARRPLVAARPEYLQAAFETIASEYGSIAEYVTHGLGVDANTLTAIRNRLLE